MIIVFNNSIHPCHATVHCVAVKGSAGKGAMAVLPTPGSHPESRSGPQPTPVHDAPCALCGSVIYYDHLIYINSKL